MPRRSIGARLYLRSNRIDRGTGRSLPDVYVIRDGEIQRSTGCGRDSLPEAERQLGDYIAAKQARAVLPGPRETSNPMEVGVADVLALYVEERAPKLASDPASTAGFVKALLGFWGDQSVAEVRRSSCQAYVVWRSQQAVKGAAKRTRLVSAQTARRELETLSAAIGYWHDEHHLTMRPKVVLPEKAESPRDALSRSETAALLRAARGSRRVNDGVWQRLSVSSRANRAHLPRFILLALYTGTRSGALLDLTWDPASGGAWVDLERGIIHRRGRLEPEHGNKRRPPAKLAPRLLAHLRRWRKIDARREAELQQRDPDFRLTAVIHHGGEPIRDKVSRGFRRCVADAGLPSAITPHWLRHTAATWLMERGVDLWLAAGYLGMTVVTLEKHYGHHRPDFQIMASSRLANTG